jgi:hypothetical protein
MRKEACWPKTLGTATLLAALLCFGSRILDAISEEYAPVEGNSFVFYIL